MTSSGRRAMFLWPRSMVMPGCCCCNSRGADSAAARWLISLRECSKAAFARATTSSSEMGVGASLLIASVRTGNRRAGRRWCSVVQSCSRRRLAVGAAVPVPVLECQWSMARGREGEEGSGGGRRRLCALAKCVPGTLNSAGAQEAKKG